MNKKFDSKKISRKEIVNYLNQSSEIAEYQLTLIDEIVTVSEVCIETLNNGGKIIGKWPTDGYEHTSSKAEKESGVFLGLAIDEDNQYELTEERINKWSVQIKKEFNI